jgi:hypothetical protein
MGKRKAWKGDGNSGESKLSVKVVVEQRLKRGGRASHAAKSRQRKHSVQIPGVGTCRDVPETSERLLWLVGAE